MGKMKEWYEVKARVRLGPDEGGDKEVTILGRVVRWEEGCVEYEADPRHRRVLLEELSLKDGAEDDEDQRGEGYPVGRGDIKMGKRGARSFEWRWRG